MLHLCERPFLLAHGSTLLLTLALGIDPIAGYTYNNPNVPVNAEEYYPSISGLIGSE